MPLVAILAAGCGARRHGHARSHPDDGAHYRPNAHTGPHPSPNANGAHAHHFANADTGQRG